MHRLGIDLGGTKIEALLLDAAGREVWRQRIATPQQDYRATLHALQSLVVTASAVAKPLSIGIGTPGSLNADGVMKNANSTWLNGQPLQRDLEALLGQAVRMANDANCLALSEATDGAGAGAEVVFAAILGTGCGAGITVRGHLLTGPNRLAGEWGHNPLPWPEAEDNPAFDCYCGQSGCLETLLSGSGIARDHARATGRQLSAAQIHAAALAGHPACLATLQRHTRRLARALAAVINVLDPDVIVLGGGVSRMPHLYEQVPALWARWVFSGGALGKVDEPVHTRLVPSQHGDASGVRGAAWLWPSAAGPSAAAG
jgi:fructokinase